MKKVRAIRCPNCGAPLKLLGGGRVKSITCEYCKSVIDLEKLDRVLASFKGVEPPVSYFKVGMEGKIDGVCWRIIGWIVYRDKEQNRWSEFLLFSAYFGYAWLIDEGESLYFSKRVRDLDLRAWGSRNLHPPKILNYNQKSFFQDDEPYAAFVDYVEGELTWIAKRGDKLYSWDYRAKDGSYLNIERSEIEVESYYTKPLNSTKVEKAFILPKKEEDLCKDNIDEILKNRKKYLNQSVAQSLNSTLFKSSKRNSKKRTYQDKLTSISTSSDSLEEGKKLNFSLVYSLILYVFLALITVYSFAFSEKVVVDSTTSKDRIYSFNISDSKKFTHIYIQKEFKPGFDNIDLNLTKANKTLFFIKYAKVSYPNKNITKYLSPVTKSIEAKLLLPPGKYYLQVKPSNESLKILVVTGEVYKKYLTIALIIFSIYFIYLIFLSKSSYPGWFVSLVFITIAISAFVVLGGVLGLLVSAAAIYFLITLSNKEKV